MFTPVRKKEAPILAAFFYVQTGKLNSTKNLWYGWYGTPVFEVNIENNDNLLSIKYHK